MSTLRINATLIMSNGMGSTHGVYLKKGTQMEEVATQAASIHQWSVDNSSDNYGRDIFKHPRLVSDRTGRTLATNVPFTHAHVPARCDIHTLSPRQKQVYNLRHLTNAEIATRIGCSEAAVNTYRICGEARIQQLEHITALL